MGATQLGLRRRLLPNVLAMLAVLGFSHAAVDIASAADYTMKLGHETAKDAQDEIANLFAKNVEKFSAGKIKAEVYNAGQLGSATKTNRDVRAGSLEATIVPSEFVTSFIPSVGALSVPGLFPNYEVQVKVIGSNAVDIIRNDAKKAGVEIVTFYPVGFSDLLLTFPMKVFADLKGRKMRARRSEELILQTRGWGMIPIPLPAGEIYTSLQQGVVDGTQNSIDFAVAFKFHEVAKYVVQSNHSASTGVIMVNKKWLDALPSELQKAVFEAGRATGPETAFDIHQRHETLAWDVVKKQATYFRLPDAERKKMKESSKPVWDLVAKNPAKKAALDAMVRAVDAITK